MLSIDEGSGVDPICAGRNGDSSWWRQQRKKKRSTGERSRPHLPDLFIYFIFLHIRKPSAL